MTGQTVAIDEAVWKRRLRYRRVFRRFSTILLFLFATLLGSQAGSQSNAKLATAPPCVASQGITPICGVHGPEDIEVLPDGKHLLISELAGDFVHAADSALLLVDLATDRVHSLPMRSKPESGWGEDSCTAPPAHLGSHGIHLSKRADGRMEVLVVNHAERESIEAIELIHNSSGYAGVWHGCVTHPTGLFNDVAATGDGGFVATIMMEKSLNARKDSIEAILSGKDTGYLVEWHPGRSLIRLPNSEAPLNNGIQLSKDRRFIYFDAWSVRQVRKYDRQAQRVVKIIDVPLQPDNLSVRGDGMFLVTGIDNLSSWKTCVLEHPAFCEMGFTVMTLDPETGATKLLYHGAPGILSGASVAVEVNSKLYVGTFMGDRLLKIDLSGSGDGSRF
jgi:sugar lactone lactonase YvrE